MDQNTCNVCNKTFSTEQELKQHQKNAHPTGQKEQDRPDMGESHRKEDKIAS